MMSNDRIKQILATWRWMSVAEQRQALNELVCEVKRLQKLTNEAQL